MLFVLLCVFVCVVLCAVVYLQLCFLCCVFLYCHVWVLLGHVMLRVVFACMCVDVVDCVGFFVCLTVMSMLVCVSVFWGCGAV